MQFLKILFETVFWISTQIVQIMPLGFSKCNFQKAFCLIQHGLSFCISGIEHHLEVG